MKWYSYLKKHCTRCYQQSERKWRHRNVLSKSGEQLSTFCVVYMWRKRKRTCEDSIVWGEAISIEVGGSSTYHKPYILKRSLLLSCPIMQLLWIITGCLFAFCGNFMLKYLTFSRVRKSEWEKEEKDTQFHLEIEFCLILSTPFRCRVPSGSASLKSDHQ